MSWDGLKQFDDWLAKQSTATDNAVKEGVAKAAALTVKDVQANFEGSHKRGQPHVGGPKPNIVTGYLRRSVIMQPLVRTGPASYSTSVGPTAIYARAIELGLRQAPNVSYPYFRPGVSEATKEFPTIMREAFAKYLS